MNNSNNKDWEKIVRDGAFQEPVSDRTRSKILIDAETFLENNQSGSANSFWQRIFGGGPLAPLSLAGLGAAMAVTLVLVFRNQKKVDMIAENTTQRAGDGLPSDILRYEFKMVQNADMLLRLETLENLELIQLMQESDSWQKIQS